MHINELRSIATFIATAELGSLQRALQNARQSKDDIAGPLRIVGPRTRFQPVVWQLLEEFCTRHPGIQPDVQREDRIGNWIEDRVDVGFRLGASAPDGVVARRLFPLQLVACAAPAYLARPGACKPTANRSNLPSRRTSAPTTKSWSCRRCCPAAASANWPA